MTETHLLLAFAAGYILAWFLYRPRRPTTHIFRDHETGIEYIGIKGFGLAPRLKPKPKL